MSAAVASVPTAHGAKYLQQLCKHWSHTLAVEFDEAQGQVIFPADMRGTVYPGDGRALMRAGAETLEVRVEGSSDAQVVRLKEVLASHLDRFAFREAPLAFDWREG